MSKATTIKEVYTNFIPGNPLKKDDEFFVPIFEKSLNKLSIDMIHTPNQKKTYLIAGQSGNGKSTLLNMINKDDVSKKYDFKYIRARESFEYINTIDIAHIVFNLAYEIIKDDDELQNKFNEKLEALEQKHNKNIQEKIEQTSKEEEKTRLKSWLSLGVNILSIFKAKSDLSSEYQFDEITKKSSVEFFKFQKQDLFILLNEIILDYKLKNKKDIIVIIDDLEKRNDVNHLFLEHTQLALLNMLDIIKIIPMPIHLARSNKVRFGEIQEFALKLMDRDGKPCDKDFDLLKKIIKKRINDKLIDDDAMDEIILKSGANLNQLISLVHKSALNALSNDTDFINIEDVNIAISDITRSNSSFVLNQRDFLNDIRDKRNIDFSEDENTTKLEKAINNGILFAYFNGNTWYDINPVCVDSLTFYNSNSY